VRRYRRSCPEELLKSLNESFPQSPDEQWYCTLEEQAVVIYRRAKRQAAYCIPLVLEGEEWISRELRVSQEAFGPLTRYLMPHKSIVNLVLAGLAAAERS